MGWTSLVGLGLRAYLSNRINLLSNHGHWRDNTRGIQLAQLRNLLERAKNTRFGNSNKFAALAALPDDQLLQAYRAQVPPADWYAYQQLIARMREGAEPDVLWPGLVRDFAQTSGTTAGDKYIPVSAEMMHSNFRASCDIFAHTRRFGVPLSRLTAGKSLFLGGTTNLATSDKGIRTGDLSGIVVPLIRWPLSQIYEPGPQVALMTHWPSKLEAIAARCLDMDVRMVSGVPSWMIVLFDRVVQLAREKGRKADSLRDVWPNLALLVHGGVKYTPFEPRVRQCWSGSPTGDDVPNRLELYPASEGFVAMQDTRGDPSLRLCVDIGNFFEFIPLEHINDPSPPAYACWEVEKGVKYVVCLSSCAGMWRYILGDVVEFDTLPASPGRAGEGPCRLRIVGRHKQFMNAFGENIIAEHVENAVARAARELSWVVGEFSAAPVYPTPSTRPRVELAVEVEGPPPPREHLDRFSSIFDAAIKEQNADYTTKRTDDVGMAAPIITTLAVGTFHRWMESRGKLGGQHKCPRCANHRDFIDGVLACAAARN